jgi:3-hydroxyacyl-CoA dehydrogenase
MPGRAGDAPGLAVARPPPAALSERPEAAYVGVGRGSGEGTMDRIALVGGGLIGQAWAIVFGRAGHEVRLYDADPAVLEQARRTIAARLDDLAALGLVDDPEEARERIRYAGTLGEALGSADYVQESAPERVEVKRALFAELDRLAAPDAILASSTSGIPASSFTAELAGRQRCLVAHPINPPFVTPLVELCPAPWTDPAVVDRTHALMLAVGQAPIRLHHEVQGFVANRMQGALLGAALRMVADGVVSVEDVDIALRHGIGLRWSFMGPFETIDLNAPGGIADYLRRYGPLYQAIEREQASPLDWGDEGLVGKVEEQRRARLRAPRLGERGVWRDRRLMALAAHKRQAAKELGD